MATIQAGDCKNLRSRWSSASKTASTWGSSQASLTKRSASRATNQSLPSSTEAPSSSPLCPSARRLHKVSWARATSGSCSTTKGNSFRTKRQHPPCLTTLWGSCRQRRRLEQRICITHGFRSRLSPLIGRETRSSVRREVRTESGLIQVWLMG